MTPLDRPDELVKVMAFAGAPMIKVLTGMRRAGKSTLLAQVADALSKNLGNDRVLLLNFERLALTHINDPFALAAHIEASLPTDGPVAVLLDEVQEVSGWERVVNSLLAEGRTDIYITGSNSKMLSSELATLIAGRYVEFEIQTLSFAEHLRFTKHFRGEADGVEAEFGRYLERGGFPGTYIAPLDDAQAAIAVSDIFASAVIRDVLERRAIRNADMLKRVAMFAFDTVGSLVSAASIARYLKSEGRKLDPDTALNYLGALADAFVLAPTPRFDVQGKRFLAVNEKYYVGDHGLVSALLGSSARRLPGILENVVWAELRRRGYTVSIGKVGDAEIDFVAARRGEQTYIQVTTTFLESPSTYTRELRPLEALTDAHPRYVLSLEPVAAPLDNGIKHLRIPDFLLGDDLR